jgi:hypothetical protein
MRNCVASFMSRRDVLRTLVVGGLWGVVGCNDSGSATTVTAPPKPNGTRAKLDKYKDTAENAAKKNQRKP